MLYALVGDGQILLETGQLPFAARRSDTGGWVLGLRDATEETRQACGWFAVEDSPRPADTETETWTPTVELIDGKPARVWQSRSVPAEQRISNQVTADLRAMLAATREQLEDRRTRRAEVAAEIGDIDAELSAARSDRERAVLRRQRRTLVAAQQVERDTAEALRACRMLARLLLGALDDTEPDVDGA